MKNLALKYRPKDLSDFIGQDIIVQTLTNAIKNNNLKQAYIFQGNLGCGKTSAARVLAASVNCLNTPGLNPCGKCDICTGIFNGNHDDIREIDAASSAGSVDEIRKIKNESLYNPINGAKTKFFIIDEFHRVSASGNDAILKLLEEPPPRVVFILCTTDIHKIRPAIQSRCQIHFFKKIPWALIADRLLSIANKENITLDKSAANLCARISDGSMRTALTNLDHLIDFVGDNNISAEKAQSLFGYASEMMYYDLFDTLLGVEEPDNKPDASKGFGIINKMLSSGCDFSIIQQGISNHLYNLMVILTCSKASELIYMSEEGKRRIKNHAKKCQEGKKLQSVLSSIGLLADSQKEIEFNISPELALQKWFLGSLFIFR